VLALAKYPNVAMKATGAPSYSDQPYRFATSTTTCAASTTPFGPRAGSGHRHHAHAVLVASVRDAVHGRAALLKGRDLELVMGRAVCDWRDGKR